MQRIDLNQAQARLPQLLEIALRGEEIIITRDEQPIAKIVPLTAADNNDDGDLQLGSARDVLIIHEDFDAPLEEFAEYR